MEIIINYIKNYLLNLDTATVVTGSIIVIFAITLILLEKKFPYTTGQKLLREGFSTILFFTPLFSRMFWDLSSVN